MKSPPERAAFRFVKKRKVWYYYQLFTPTPIRILKRFFGSLLRHRQHRLALLACLMMFTLGFVCRMERYQAREIRAFIQETQRRQGDMAWMLSRTEERRQQRVARWQAAGQVPPAASDQVDAREFAACIGVRASAGIPAPQGEASFPALDHTVYPVSVVPDWGAMRSPAQWDRPFSQIPEREFVSLPAYDLQTLQIPLASLANPLRAESIPTLTAKLTYSTRYYGAYDLDAGEFSGLHPGIDLKLAFGTPVGAIAGGRVHRLTKDESGLGLYVIVEHRLGGGERIFSIYGHLDTAWVREGEDLRPGQTIGTIGLSGRTTAPHLHLQIDRDDGSVPHRVYWPTRIPVRSEASQYTLHPITFVQQHARTLTQAFR